MRLLRLGLIAYGPFTDEVLDLSHDGLHVVYGPNEAGKSTSLRAITGLLYGIERQTNDDHVHAYKALRIGGRIAFGDERIDVVRRKADKRSLMDEAEQPLDEAVMTRALGGVSRELFLAMFGLDHVTLRSGAQALLRGEGSVGESLFDAGGARGIGDVLDGLRGEAEALFKPRGQTQLLNEALKALEASRKEIQYREIVPKSYLDQEKALASSTADRDALLAERDAMAREQKRLSRALRVLKPLAKRREFLARMRELGEIPRLADDATEQRQAAERAFAEGARDSARLAEEEIRLGAQHAAVYVDEALLEALDDTVAEQLAHMRGVHVKAEADMPKRRAQLRAIESDARLTLTELGRDVPLEDVEALRLDKMLQTQIEELSKTRGAIVEKRDAATRALTVLRARAQAIDVGLVELGPPVDGAALASAVDRAVRAGDVDAAIAKLDARVATSAARAMRMLSSLGRVDASLDEVVALVLPDRDVVRAHDERLRQDEDAAAASLHEERALDQEREQLERARDELLRGGEIPTEDMLREARAEREQSWARVKDKLGKVGVRSYEEAVARADDVADRLRREADRVARQARIDADSASILRRHAHMVETRAGLERERAAHAAAWAALWPPPIRAGVPAEMLAWLDNHRALCDAVDELGEQRAELEGSCEARAQQCALLLAALSPHVPAASLQASSKTALLSALLADAEPLLARLREVARRRDELGDQRQQVAAEIARLEPEHAEHGEALDEWRAAWASAMARVGLAADASVAEAGAVVSALRELFGKVREAEQMRQRIVGMERDAGEFGDALAPLIAAHAPELADTPVAAAASALLARRIEALKARETRDALEATRARKRAELVEAERRRDGARLALGELARAAGVADPDAIEEMERRAEKLLALQREIAECEDELFAEGSSIDELEASCRDVEKDVAHEQLADIENLLARHDERLRELEGAIGNQSAGLTLFESRDGAHALAEACQEHLAHVRELAERYAKLRLAAVILEQEIERYREMNQGPIIRRASKLFPRLTLGEYDKVYVDFDAQALRCVGVDGADVAVEGLSDGARDQLYLALRLASLEHYAEHAELMPFIADDILVHFDEERARASLRVLSEFCATTQVLMFTHQARHVELAREVVPADALRVHELRGGRRRAKAV